MKKTLKEEFLRLQKEVRLLDYKSAIIFIGSTILFTISWYFSNPKYFGEFFNSHETFKFIDKEFAAFGYWFILDSVLFFFIPLIIIKLILNEKIKNYGLAFKNVKIGWFVFIISIVFFIPIIFFISNSETFSQFFPLMENAKNDFLIFLLYETLFILFIFSWEFIFRGFMLFGLEKRFGIYSIFIQMIPFVILHNGKPFIETIASIFGAIFLGYLALRTRSIFYGFCIHVFILITLDIIAFIKA